MPINKNRFIIAGSSNTEYAKSLSKKTRIPLAKVTIGTTYGWNTHSLDEYMDKNSFPLGIKQVFMVIYSIASSY